eukprot:scaffold13435_cov33-Tisochrysis_lutea.AAC.1
MEIGIYFMQHQQHRHYAPCTHYYRTRMTDKNGKSGRSRRGRALHWQLPIFPREPPDTAFCTSRTIVPFSC